MNARVSTTLLAALTCGAALAGDVDARSLLGMVDVSHPRYGTKTFGAPKVNAFRARDGSALLAYQARYGGDGDHSENLLKLFTFEAGKPRKLVDQNIDFVTFVEEGGALKRVKGKVVESLCDVCDGWEAALPEDVFMIPIAIDVETLAVRVELDQGARRELLSRLRRRVEANLSERARDTRGYPAFAASATRRVEELLGRR